MTSLPSYGKVQETQPWNASVYFCSRPLHACHDSSLSYKSLDIGPSSTLSLWHFNSTRVCHCNVELILKAESARCLYFFNGPESEALDTNYIIQKPLLSRSFSCISC